MLDKSLWQVFTISILRVHSNIGKLLANIYYIKERTNLAPHKSTKPKILIKSGRKLNDTLIIYFLMSTKKIKLIFSSI